MAQWFLPIVQSCLQNKEERVSVRNKLQWGAVLYMTLRMIICFGASVFDAKDSQYAGKPLLCLLICSALFTMNKGLPSPTISCL